MSHDIKNVLLKILVSDTYSYVFCFVFTTTQILIKSGLLYNCDNAILETVECMHKPKYAMYLYG